MVTICGPIYATEVKGLDDTLAGIIMASLGISTVIYALILGHMPDRYGVKKSIIMAYMVGLIGFVIIVSSNDIIIQVTAIVLCITASTALSVPSAKLGIKRYTTESARSMAYSLFYLIVFGASAIGGVLVDFIISLGKVDENSFWNILFAGGICMSVATGLCFLLREIEYNSTGERVLEVNQEHSSAWEHTRAIFVLKSFWRFTGLTMLIVIVRAIYLHLEINLSIYMYRDIEQGAHFGYMLALHQLIMIIFAPIMTFLIYYFNHYTLLIFGGFLSAVSPLVFIFDSSYVTVFLFVFIASVAESIFAPRLIDYTLQIAPKGKEGVFLAVAASPLPLSLIISGLMGGVLLSEYCPSEGERHCWKMWAIISGLTLFAVFLMITLRSWLEQPKIEEQPYISCSREAKKLEEL
mmetsp:Transcript_7355/g.7206  ORF Transcript_7355/g.7206 Transcript_7355/m.7206 type:complete len:409 (-) Transcript_7355:38-1264(-)